VIKRYDTALNKSPKRKLKEFLVFSQLPKIVINCSRLATKLFSSSIVPIDSREVRNKFS
jgi:hypothetical protein